MTTNKFLWVVAIMSLTIFAAHSGLFIGPAISYESVEQERAICIQDCKSRYGYSPYFHGGGGMSGTYWVYAKCIDDCEKKFWKEWQKDQDKTEKD